MSKKGKLGWVWFIIILVLVSLISFIYGLFQPQDLTKPVYDVGKYALIVLWSVVIYFILQFLLNFDLKDYK